ncbi:uncharacterized mitochondrial protein AtMg00810-like isoform X1 [Solanum dulcamara]|uniref:uncharacterized mitochondrial protein AtMg00810-like isoform X1 n=1 Tax=Solanum dulcamara TaxID=45834 RepID=UPI00248652D9|nr:uncharacterized mitochondrial protein AtMg00810-like isoform X1 [Solanum dulcamara]
MDGIFLSPRKYAIDLLKKFNVLNCKVAATPMNINEKLCHDDGTEMENATYFRSLVGGLNYLSHTRPDIAFSVGVVSRFMHSPSKLHLGAAKRILRYIAETTDHGIWYSKVALMIERADWVSCLIWDLEQFHGVQRSRKWWPYQLQRLNIL